METTGIQFNVQVYTDNVYHEADRAQYGLYVILSNEHIALVIVNQAQKQVLQLQLLFPIHFSVFACDYEALKHSEQLTNLLKGNFAFVKAIVCNDASTLVPEPLLHAADATAYFKLNQKQFPASGVFEFKMSSLRTAALFNVKNDLIRFLNEQLPGVQVLHDSLIFLKALDLQSFPNASNKLHVLVHPTYIAIACINHQIKFYNTFPFNNENDIAYFVLAVAKQLELNQEAEVLLYGQVPILSDITNLLANYVKSIAFGAKPKGVAYPVSFHQLPAHHYFIETSCLLCE
jgi:hypothetical protein